ncbi:aldolase [Roseibium sp. FZY0029]|uniref:HPr kinase/phosphorylase n=1 Tax=Roseibium sp. FZY0029 TaxID=3116647 RepID=UPI002EA96FA2|nr:aldolase [Roseibium sp. FZY0029]
MTPPAVHANCVIVGTVGLLIRGGAGSGKTSLADSLIEAARAKGNLGCLVADDYTHVVAVDGHLEAHAPQTIEGCMEVRGFGLVEAPFARCAQIHLVIELSPAESIERLPEQPLAQICLDGMQVPVLICPQNDPALCLRLIRWALRSLFPKAPDYI